MHKQVVHQSLGSPPCGDTLMSRVVLFGRFERLGARSRRHRDGDQLANVMTLGAARSPKFALPHGHISLMPVCTHPVLHLLHFCRLDHPASLVQSLTRVSVLLPTLMCVCVCVCVCVCLDNGLHTRSWLGERAQRLLPSRRDLRTVRSADNGRWQLIPAILIFPWHILYCCSDAACSLVFTLVCPPA